MPEVRLGNSSAVHGIPPVPLPGNRITEVGVASDRTRSEQMRDITHPDDGMWPRHSTAAAPDWVESDDPELAEAIAEHYGCPIGRPEDWEVQA